MKFSSLYPRLAQLRLESKAKVEIGKFGTNFTQFCTNSFPKATFVQLFLIKSLETFLRTIFRAPAPKGSARKCVRIRH